MSDEKALRLTARQLEELSEIERRIKETGLRCARRNGAGGLSHVVRGNLERRRLITWVSPGCYEITPAGYDAISLARSKSKV